MRLVSILTLALPPAFGFTSHVVHPSLGNGGVVKTRPKVIDRPIHHQTFASTSTALAAVPSVDSDALLTFFLQKLIETSVPTLGVIAVIAFGASTFSGGRKSKDETDSDESDIDELYTDLYGSKENDGIPPFLQKLMGTSTKKTQNLGFPAKEYIKIEKLNEKYNSFQYSLEKETRSKLFAVSSLRGKNFETAMGRGFASTTNSTKISPTAIKQLLDSEKVFLKTAGEYADNIAAAYSKLNLLEVNDMEIDWEDLPERNKTETALNITKFFPKKNSPEKIRKELVKNTENLQKSEQAFKSRILEVLIQDSCDEEAEQKLIGFKKIISGMDTTGTKLAGSLLTSVKERPLKTVLTSLGYIGESYKKDVFVLDFNGDVTASQVQELREEVTAILTHQALNSEIETEVVLTLQTGGGTVTGYGLAAAQLGRIKAANIPLTICVEQVAASGGYMMACAADTIVASPFAVLGSIGVISEQPNVYERLKKEGIEFQTVTAGKYKRTLTPFKKATKDDFEKSKSDVEDILTLFKGFVKKNRPKLDIDLVATGETWFGEDALERNLCDKIATRDEVITDFISQGHNVYQITYDEGDGSDLPFLGGRVKSSRSPSLVRRVVRYFVDEVRSEFTDKNAFNEKYQMKYEDRNYFM